MSIPSFDPKVLAEEMLAAVKEYVGRKLAALESKLTAMITALPKPKDGVDGKSVTLEQVLAALPKPKDGVDGKSISKEEITELLRQMLAAAALPTAETMRVEVARQVTAIPAPKDGRDAPSIEQITAAIKAEVASLPKPKDGVDGEDGEDGESVSLEQVLAALPKPKDGADGKSVSKEEIELIVRAQVEHTVAALPKPKDGVSVSAEAVQEMVAEQVAALPKPKDGSDGKSVHPDTITLMVNEAISKAVSALPKPKDGMDGASVTLEQIRPALAELVAALPKPKDGEDGKDATALNFLPGIEENRRYPRGTWATHRSGLIYAERMTDPVTDDNLEKAGWIVAVEGVAALVVTQGDDLRSFIVASMLTSGRSLVSNFKLPVILYQGIWKDGNDYEGGDITTWGGSMWHCQKSSTKDKPGTSDAWKLCVKHGSPGKDVGSADPKPAPGPVRLK